MLILAKRCLKHLLPAAALIALPLAGSAWQPPDPGLTVEIVADDGRVLRAFDVSRAGERDTRRAYLEAIRNQRYGIRVRNRSNRRIGLVLAVDGRNIISGARSHLARTEPMYILDAYQSASYDGWRTSDAQVHRFFFTESGDSYAGAFGDHSAMGVIAVAAFAQRTPPRRKLHLEEQRRDRAAAGAAQRKAAPASAPSAEADDVDSQPGTGFGEGRRSPVVRVDFEPQPHAFAKRFFKYEWRETLVRLGFVTEVTPENRFWPWERASNVGFAPYPPSYWRQR